MASPEAICGNCRYFDINDVNGNRIEPIALQKERSGIVGYCRAPLQETPERLGWPLETESHG